MSSSEDEDLKLAITMSLQASSPTASSAQPTSTSTTTNGGFIGLDRKAMERERLARLGKRKRDQSPSEGPSKQVARPSATTSLTGTSSSSSSILQYPQGAVKRTIATKFPRTDEVSIDELLEAPKVNIAVLSSYMFNADWLFEKIDPREVKQIWVMSAKDKDVQEKLVHELVETNTPNLKLHFPPMEGLINNMHAKYLLLFGSEKLRIAIPTANMVQSDWGEVPNDWQPGVMENSVFLIDLPRRSDEGKKEALTPFGRELVKFLEQQKLGRRVIEGVHKFDFSQTGHLAFVHSIGGSYKTESYHPTGLPGLTKAIQDLQLGNVNAIEIDYAASSLGAVTDGLLQRVYLAACGIPFSTATESSVPNVRDHIRIYFPTNDTVQQSIGGPDCGGVICLSQKHYNSSTFPKECLRDYESLRRGMLSHNKLLFARGRKKDGKPFAWVYIGSANVSESAWGGQKVLKSGTMGALTIRNWECGVVLPVPDSKFEQLENDKVPPMSVFEGTVEVPFKFPGDKYEGKKPWFFRPG